MLQQVYVQITSERNCEKIIEFASYLRAIAKK